MNEPAPERGATTLSIATVWQGHTRLDKVKFRNTRFDGSQSPERTWEVWRRGHAVGVLPYDPVTDQLVLIEQFRYGALAAGMDPVLLELPCGFIDGDETPEQAGAREMQEEIGMQAHRLLHVGRFLLSPGGSDESVTIYAGYLPHPPGRRKRHRGLWRPGQRERGYPHPRRAGGTGDRDCTGRRLSQLDYRHRFALVRSPP